MKRKYPVGVQSFESIRKDGYMYVDKTELIYKMITEGKPYFLSRPRRFGKSLLCSTLEAVFLGRRELFEAFTTEDGIEQPQLFIATTSWKWQPHPVIRFDFSQGKEYTVEALERMIDFILTKYEKKYGLAPKEGESSNLRFISLVEEAHRQSGQRVAVIVDEYDNFMLHSIGNNQLETDVRTSFSNLFGPLKSLDDHLQFVFITGISKFSQMGIFSTLNNLKGLANLGILQQIGRNLARVLVYLGQKAQPQNLHPPLRERLGLEFWQLHENQVQPIDDLLGELVVDQMVVVVVVFDIV